MNHFCFHKCFGFANDVRRNIFFGGGILTLSLMYIKVYNLLCLVIDWLLFCCKHAHRYLSLFFILTVKLGVIFLLLTKYKNCLPGWAFYFPFLFYFLPFLSKKPILHFEISLQVTRGTSIKKIRHYEKSLLLKDFNIHAFVTPLLPIFI